MLAIKPGVSIKLISPQALLALLAAEDVYSIYNIPVTLTAGEDGKHGPNSLHYVGKAIDLRLPSWHGLSAEADKVVHRLLKNNLGDEYDVVLEGNHIHVEFDPPKPNEAGDNNGIA